MTPIPTVRFSTRLCVDSRLSPTRSTTPGHCRQTNPDLVELGCVFQHQGNDEIKNSLTAGI